MQVGVTGELTLKGEMLKVAGIDEKLTTLREDRLAKVVLPMANEEEARKENALQFVVLVDDVKGLVEASVQGESERAAAASRAADADAAAADDGNR